MPAGTLEIEVPDVGIVEFPAETKPADIEAILNRTYGPKGTPEVPEFKSPIELPKAGPGEKSVYEEPTWMDEPTVKLGDFLIKGPHEAKSPTEEGVNKTLREGINSLTSPRNLLYMLGSMGVAATGQAAKALVGAIWTGAMGSNAIQNAPQLYARMGEEMAKPPEKRDKELLGELGTQAFIDTGFFVAPAVGLKKVLTETPKLTPTPEVSDASKVQETAAVHGDVRPQPEQGVREVPVQESGAGVQPQAPQGEVPLKPTVTETTPPVPSSEMPKTPSQTGLYPAVREVGGKVDVAEAGTTHPEIIKEEGLKAEDIDQRGFVDEQGKFKDREQAAEAAPQVPTEREAERLHSTDLPEAKAVKPFEVDDQLVMRSPHTGDDTIVSYRGKPSEGQAVVWTGKTQIQIPESWLRRKGEEYVESRTDIPGRSGGGTTGSGVSSGGGTGEVIPQVKTVSGLSKRQLIEQLIGKKPEPAIAANVSQRIQWEKNRKTYEKLTKPELVSRVEESRRISQEQAAIQSLVQPIFDELKSAAESSGHSWRSVLRQRAESEGVRFYSPPDSTRGETAATLARAIAEKRHRQSQLSGPGTPAAAQPPDPGGPLGLLPQLTHEVLRQQAERVKAPLSQRIDNALEISRRLSKGRDAVSRTIANMRAASLAAFDKYAHLDPWRNFEESLGRWIGADQKTSLEVHEFQKAIHKSVPQRIRQEAMTNWIQADGDLNVLRERAAASKGYTKRGYETALQLTEAEKHLARTAQVYLEARLKEGIDAGLLKQGVDNYITQIWKRPTSTTQRMWADLFGVGTLNPNFKYAKKRIFESYFEGEQAGFEPKDKRVGSLIAAYDLAFNRALSARAFIKELQGGTASDGKPIAMTSGKTMPLPAGETPPEVVLIKPNFSPKGAVSEDGRPYRPIDHWALRDWKWATKGPEGQNVFVQGDMLVHPDHWDHLNKALKTSRLRQIPVVRELLKAGAFAKQTKLSLSPFHYTQEGVHALAHRVNPANLTDINLEVPLQKALVDHGLMVSDPRAYELFSEGAAGGGLVGKIPLLGRLQTEFNDILFKDYIPRLKMTMALDAWERNKTAYAKDISSGKITEDQLMALTARESNAAFGEQNYKMMGRSETLQDFFRLTLLAPDFLEARFRFVGQALKPYGREQRIALAFMAGFMYVGGRILNQWLDKDPHWDKPFSVFHNGREYRLRTVLGDVQHLITNPRSFWYNRMSPFLRTATEYITSRDMRGIKRSSMEQLADAADWFKPISVSKRPEDTMLQTALTASGIPSAPSGAREEVYKLVDKWRQSQTDPKIREQYDRLRQETLPISPYEPLRKALRAGNVKAAQEAYTKLHQTRTRDSIIRALKPKPFTGGVATESKFRAGLSAREKELYQKALKEQRDMLNLFYKLQ